MSERNGWIVRVTPSSRFPFSPSRRGTPGNAPPDVDTVGVGRSETLPDDDSRAVQAREPEPHSQPTAMVLSNGIQHSSPSAICGSGKSSCGPAQLKTRGPALVQAGPLVHALGTGFGDEPARFEHRSAGSVRWTSGRRLPVALVRQMHESLAPPGPARSAKHRQSFRLHGSPREYSDSRMLVIRPLAGAEFSGGHLAQDAGARNARNQGGGGMNRASDSGPARDRAYGHGIHSPLITSARRLRRCLPVGC